LSGDGYDILEYRIPVLSLKIKRIGG